jgi:hypothetical protein
MQTFPQLERYGFKALLTKFVVPNANAIELASVLEGELGKEKPSANRLNSMMHSKYSEYRFNELTPEVASIIGKLNTGSNFEDLCNVIGVSSQRSKNGNVGVAQVMTIVRQMFGLGTFYSSHKVNGVKGAYILSADDKTIDLGKTFRKLTKIKFSDRANMLIDGSMTKALKRPLSSHLRTELFPVWSQQHEINRAILANAPEWVAQALSDQSALFEVDNNTNYTNNAEIDKSIDMPSVQDLYELNGANIPGTTGKRFRKGNLIFDDLYDWIAEDGSKLPVISQKYFTKVA